MAETLLTGASGFLGKYIYEAVPSATTFGRDNNSNITGDISSPIETRLNFDFVVHCAGLAHVPAKGNEKLFYEVNYEGTRNLLNACEKSQLKGVVFISSVATYGIEQGFNIDEQTELKANDPYGKSKINAESLLAEFCESNSVPYLILRLPLIAGKNPPGNLGAMMKGIQNGRYFRIGNGQTRRSVVLAKDVAALISQWIASSDKKSGIYNLTDNYNPSFYELEEQIRIHFSKSKIISLPISLARLVAKFGDLIPKFPLSSKRLSKMTSALTFDCSKAMRELNWQPKKVTETLWM